MGQVIKMGAAPEAGKGTPVRGGGDRKKLAGALAVAAATLTVGAVALATRPSAAADRESLNRQRAALGMPDPEQRRARMLDGMALELGLTGGQKAQMKAALEAGPDPRTLFGDRSLSREQRFARMGRLMEERRARVRAVLTPEQQAKYEQMEARRRERFRGMGGSGGFGGRPGRFPGGGPGR